MHDHPQAERLRTRFFELYRKQPRIFRAPGRVNLIGEHTDYNDGFVMPVAIELSTWVAIAPRQDQIVQVTSTSFADGAEFEVNKIHSGPTGHWSDYVRGVIAVLGARYPQILGADILVHGEVPIGAGLSSSAAIEIATAYALLKIFGITLDRVQLALAAQQAEHEYAGTLCGIMDQFISANAKAGHALMLDTRRLQFEFLPIPSGVSMAICDTGIKHTLAGSEYNRRREQCETGVAHLAKFLPYVKALRDVTLQDLEKYGADLPDVIFRRCRHVISENHRVLAAVEALRRGDCERFGALMAESHRSLRDDYEVSCPELDAMVAATAQIPGVYGARMTGGGFGGCTINLVATDQLQAFCSEVLREYQRATAQTAKVYTSKASEGVEEIVNGDDSGAQRPSGAGEMKKA
jgi:galactokinase